MRRGNVPMRSLLSMPFLVYLSIIVLFRGWRGAGMGKTGDLVAPIWRDTA